MIIVNGESIDWKKADISFEEVALLAGYKPPFYGVSVKAMPPNEVCSALMHHGGCIDRGWNGETLNGYAFNAFKAP